MLHQCLLVNDTDCRSLDITYQSHRMIASNHIALRSNYGASTFFCGNQAFGRIVCRIPGSFGFKIQATLPLDRVILKFPSLNSVEQKDELQVVETDFSCRVIDVWRESITIGKNRYPLG